jgi:RES domain-containing protein
VNHVERGGAYLRVCGRTWIDPLDTAYSRRYGGRWNVPGAFGMLYLCANKAVAAAFVRVNFAGEIATLMDLQPDVLPDLLEVDVRSAQFVDATSDAGLRALGLPTSYPVGVGWEQCQQIGQRVYTAGERGIACRSASEATEAGWVGEELAVCDTQLALVHERSRYDFDRWYKRGQ